MASRIETVISVNKRFYTDNGKKIRKLDLGRGRRPLS